jgi:PAS domain-containing protein
MLPTPWLPLAFAAAAIPPAVLLGLLWPQRDEPGVAAYAAMLVGMICYDLAYVVTLMVVDAGLHERLYPAATTIKLATSIPWLVFTLEYTGRAKYVTRRLVATLGAIPLLAVTLILSPFRVGLLLRNYSIDQQAGLVFSNFENGPVWLVFAAVGFCLIAAGLVMLLEFVLTQRRQYSHQAAILVVAGLLPGLSTLVHLARLGPLPILDLTPLAFAAAAAIVGIGVVRYDVFGFTPATHRAGQAAAIDDFADAVLIVDEDRQVVDLNERASALFHRHEVAFGRTSLSTLFETAVDVEAPEGTIDLETERGRREFDLTTSPVEGPRGDAIGYTVVLHDVTEEKQRRQRFEVLNRILRHNLRNAMNAVMGYATRLEDHTDVEADWMLDRVQRQTAQVVELSERASAIDRVTAPETARKTFAVGEVLDAVGDRLVADHPDLEVTVHVPGTLRMTSNRVVVEEVVRYAASTLVGYNGTEAPRLVFTATPADGIRPWVRLSITSNGAPVPAEERAVIERGEETPLDHSHDLDLWLVAWGVETLGGELSFVEMEDRPGVSVRIPDYDERGHESDSPESSA